MDHIRFQAFTPRTITSKRRLAEEFNRVKKGGYAVDLREIEEDVECVYASSNRTTWAMSWRP